MIVSVPVATVWAAPDAPRPVDAAAVAALPDPAAWAAALTPRERLGLHGRTLTQALLGEPAIPLAERDGWVQVALAWQPAEDPRGYVGWVRHEHLAEGDPVPGVPAVEPAYVVTAPTAELDTPSGPLIVSFGTRLARDGDRILLSGGRTATLPDRQASADLSLDPLALALQFVGLPYLWGGTSGWGLDCSGLVHLTQRALGRTVPRDSPAQCVASTGVDLERAAPGDSYFFAHADGRIYHVGYATSRAADGSRTMLHAPEGDETNHGRIEDEPIAARRVAELVSAGTFP